MTGDAAGGNGDDLVYGSLYDGTLAVVEREWALAVVAEGTEWFAAKTVREAMALAERCDTLSPPVQPEELEEMDPDEPFDARETASCSDGDWPPSPAQATLDFLPESWGIGGVLDTTFSGEIAQIDPDQEPALLAAAKKDGVKLTRDDALIGQLMFDN